MSAFEATATPDGRETSGLDLAGLMIWHTTAASAAAGIDSLTFLSALVSRPAHFRVLLRPRSCAA